MSRSWKGLGIYEFMFYFHLGWCLLAGCNYVGQIHVLLFL